MLLRSIVSISLFIVSSACFAGNTCKTFQQCQEKAQQNDAQAQYNLGIIYDNGEGVPKDNTLAYMYYNLAERSLPKAKEVRNDLEKTMTQAQIRTRKNINKKLAK